MVDAGVSEPERARELLELGAHRVIVGTETLSGPDASTGCSRRSPSWS